MQIGEAEFSQSADWEVGFEPLSKRNNFELDCYRRVSVLKQGGHKNGHSRCFWGVFGLLRSALSC